MTEEHKPTIKAVDELDLSGTDEMQEVTQASDELATAYDKLTDKQKIFVDSRLTGMSPIASAKAAGYADYNKIAHQMERSPRIKDALKAASKLARVKIDLTRDDVLQGLMDSLDMCATATEMINVWKEIGKIIGAYQPLEIKHTVNLAEMTNNQLQRMSSEELAALVGKPQSVVDLSTNQAIDGEFQVLKDAITPPKPIEYDNEE